MAESKVKFKGGSAGKLHFEDIGSDRALEFFTELGERYIDLVGSMVRKYLNLPENDQTPLCGGCLMGSLESLAMEFCLAGNLDNPESAEFFTDISKDFAELAIKSDPAAAFRNIIQGALARGADIDEALKQATTMIGKIAKIQINVEEINLDDLPREATIN